MHPLSLFFISRSQHLIPQNEDLDAILKRSVTREYHEAHGASALSKVTYCVPDQPGMDSVDLHDVDFWAKVFPNMKTPEDFFHDLSIGKVTTREECDHFVADIERVCEGLSDTTNLLPHEVINMLPRMHQMSSLIRSFLSGNNRDISHISFQKALELEKSLNLDRKSRRRPPIATKGMQDTQYESDNSLDEEEEAFSFEEESSSDEASFGEEEEVPKKRFKKKYDSEEMIPSLSRSGKWDDKLIWKLIDGLMQWGAVRWKLIYQHLKNSSFDKSFCPTKDQFLSLMENITSEILLVNRPSFLQNCHSSLLLSHTASNPVEPNVANQGKDFHDKSLSTYLNILQRLVKFCCNSFLNYCANEMMYFKSKNQKLNAEKRNKNENECKKNFSYSKKTEKELKNRFSIILQLPSRTPPYHFYPGHSCDVLVTFNLSKSFRSAFSGSYEPFLYLLVCYETEVAHSPEFYPLRAKKICSLSQLLGISGERKEQPTDVDKSSQTPPELSRKQLTVKVAIPGFIGRYHCVCALVECLVDVNDITYESLKVTIIPALNSLYFEVKTHPLLEEFFLQHKVSRSRGLISQRLQTLQQMWEISSKKGEQIFNTMKIPDILRSSIVPSWWGEKEDQYLLSFVWKRGCGVYDGLLLELARTLPSDITRSNDWALSLNSNVLNTRVRQIINYFFDFVLKASENNKPSQNNLSFQTTKLVSSTTSIVATPGKTQPLEQEAQPVSPESCKDDRIEQTLKWCQLFTKHNHTSEHPYAAHGSRVRHSTEPPKVTGELAGGNSLLKFLNAFQNSQSQGAPISSDAPQLSYTSLSFSSTTVLPSFTSSSSLSRSTSTPIVSSTATTFAPRYSTTSSSSAFFNMPNFSTFSTFSSFSNERSTAHVSSPVPPDPPKVASFFFKTLSALSTVPTLQNPQRKVFDLSRDEQEGMDGADMK